MATRLEREVAYQIQPALYESLLSLDKASANKLSKRLVHLVKLHGSQLNHCGFCLEMHHRESRADGIEQKELDVLLAWREVDAFSPAEKAALNWVEILTQLPQSERLAPAYKSLEEHYNQEEIVALTGLIITINGWNRLAISFGF